MMLFTKDMTYPQAVKALFQAMENKTESEKKGIIDEYKKTIPDITKNEIERDEGYLTSYAMTVEAVPAKVGILNALEDD